MVTKDIKSGAQHYTEVDTDVLSNGNRHATKTCKSTNRTNSSRYPAGNSTAHTNTRRRDSRGEDEHDYLETTNQDPKSYHNSTRETNKSNSGKHPQSYQTKTATRSRTVDPYSTRNTNVGARTSRSEVHITRRDSRGESEYDFVETTHGDPTSYHKSTRQTTRNKSSPGATNSTVHETRRGSRGHYDFVETTNQDPGSYQRFTRQTKRYPVDNYDFTDTKNQRGRGSRDEEDYLDTNPRAFHKAPKQTNQSSRYPQGTNVEGRNMTKDQYASNNTRPGTSTVHLHNTRRTSRGEDNYDYVETTNEDPRSYNKTTRETNRTDNGGKSTIHVNTTRRSSRGQEEHDYLETTNEDPKSYHRSTRETSQTKSDRFPLETANSTVHVHTTRRSSRGQEEHDYLETTNEDPRSYHRSTRQTNQSRSNRYPQSTNAVCRNVTKTATNGPYTTTTHANTTRRDSREQDYDYLETTNFDPRCGHQTTQPTHQPTAIRTGPHGYTRTETTYNTSRNTPEESFHMQRCNPGSECSSEFDFNVEVTTSDDYPGHATTGEYPVGHTTRSGREFTSMDDYPGRATTGEYPGGHTTRSGREFTTRDNYPGEYTQNSYNRTDTNLGTRTSRSEVHTARRDSRGREDYYYVETTNEDPRSYNKSTRQTNQSSRSPGGATNSTTHFQSVRRNSHGEEEYDYVETINQDPTSYHHTTRETTRSGYPHETNQSYNRYTANNQSGSEDYIGTHTNGTVDQRHESTRHTDHFDYDPFATQNFATFDDDPFETQNYGIFDDDPSSRGGETTRGTRRSSRDQYSNDVNYDKSVKSRNYTNDDRSLNK